MCGFKEGHINNTLDVILFIYAHIRLGNIKQNVDKFGAAVCVCKKHYLSTVKDNKEPGTGVWTIALTHMLNGHMVQHANPILLRS